MTFLLKRGRGAMRRVAHLSLHDAATGQPTFRPLCGDKRLRFDLTSNVPWGRPRCRRCMRALERLDAGQ